jgi:transcription initiation factor TFIID subunit 10
LVALAAQKFIADVSNDAAQYSKLRLSKERSKSKELVLKMEDLSQALQEYGVNVNKPAYFADAD